MPPPKNRKTDVIVPDAPAVTPPERPSAKEEAPAGVACQVCGNVTDEKLCPVDGNEVKRG